VHEVGDGRADPRQLRREEDRRGRGGEVDERVDGAGERAMSRLLAWITSILLLFLVAEGLTRLLSTATPLEPDPRLRWVYKKHVHPTRPTHGQTRGCRPSAQR